MSKYPVYNRIKELRLEANMNQTEIAAKLGLHTTQYSRYERSEGAIPIQFFIQIANFHNVSIDYIVERTDERKMNTKEE